MHKSQRQRDRTVTTLGPFQD